MNKFSKKVLILAGLVLLAAPAIGFAREEEPGDDRGGDRAEIRSELRTGISDLKASTSAKREEVREKVRENRSERIREYAEKSAEVLSRINSKLSELADRLEDRIEKIESTKNISLDTAKARLAEARSAITAAGVSISGIMPAVNAEIGTGETAKDDFADVREIVRNARESVKTAHTSLVLAIREVKVALGLTENKGSGNNASSTDGD